MWRIYAVSSQNCFPAVLRTNVVSSTLRDLSCANCRRLQNQFGTLRQFSTTVRNGQMRKMAAQKAPEKIPLKNTSWADVKRLMSLAKPEKQRLAAAIGLLAVSSAVTLSVPFFIGKLIDMAFSPAEKSADETDVNSEPIGNRLKRYCGGLAVIFLIGAVCNFGRIYLMNSSGERVVNRLRTTVFGSLLRQEIGFFDKNKTGELINRLSNDTSVIGYAVTMNISDGLRSVAAAAGGIGMMFYVSPKLAIVGLSIIPPIAVVAITYGRYVHKLTQQVNDALADATQVAEERLSNIRTIRAFATEKKEDRSYKEKIEKVLQLAYKNAMASGIFYGFTGLSGNLSVLAVLYYGGNLISTGEITIGDLSSFLMYVVYVGVSIGGISSFYSELMRGLGSSTRLFELANRVPLIPIEGGIQLPNFRGDIEFRNVYFSYPGRADSPILSNFNLTCPAGTVTALVGASGIGKSTIGSLLLRYYEVDKGGVFLDGVDLKELDPTWMRQQFGVVSQEPILFSTSVRDNICYGWSNPSEVPLEVIYDGVKKANAYNFIKAFPDELNTVLGEKGANLSGGQRQRVAIARALLQDPTVLLLDEATSALDAESEFLVREALENLIRDRDRTVIMIAHRLSTVKHADQIAVILNGKIAEKGSYAQLMAIPDGQFRRLVERQTIASDSPAEKKSVMMAEEPEEKDSEEAMAKCWTQPTSAS